MIHHIHHSSYSWFSSFIIYHIDHTSHVIKYHQMSSSPRPWPCGPGPVQDHPADVPSGNFHCFADVPRGGQWRRHALRHLAMAWSCEGPVNPIRNLQRWWKPHASEKKAGVLARLLDLRNLRPREAKRSHRLVYVYIYNIYVHNINLNPLHQPSQLLSLPTSTDSSWGTLLQVGYAGCATDFRVLCERSPFKSLWDKSSVSEST